MKILLILLCALIFENTINQIEAGKINQEKSFAEIFGQRWDERTEENMYRIGPIIYEENADQNNQFGQNDQHIDQIVDESLEVKEEQSEEMSTDCDELGGQLPMSTNIGQICEDFSKAIDKKKREIVEKFQKIKEKVKQMEKKYSTKEWQKIERKIAKKLGTNQKKIYEWKTEFGMIKKHYYTDDEKYKKVKQFDQIYGKLKTKFNEKLDGKKEKSKKIIAKHLGININSIYNWKKQFQNGKSFINQKIDDEKKEIVEKYFKIKSEFLQMGKHSQKEWEEFGIKIKQMFGVSHMTIENLAKKLNMKQNVSKERKMLTIAEKMEVIKQYYQIKEQNPKLKEDEIAKILNIPKNSLRKYKAKFGIKPKNKLL